MNYKNRIHNFWKESFVNRAIIVTISLMIVIGTLFGAFYYWDRYVHTGTISPNEIELSKLEDLVRENPNDPAARVSLIQYYYTNGMFKEAKEQVEQVLEVYPEYESALYLAGMTNMQLGDSRSAVPSLVKFIDLRHKKPVSLKDRYLETALYYLGVSYIQLGEPEQAVSSLTEVLTLNQMDADAMYQLGLAYAMNGQHQKAIEQYSNAVRFVPDFAEAYTGMIESYSDLGLRNFEVYAQGMREFSNRDYKTALTHLEEAASTLENFNPVFLGLGLTFEQLGNFEDAQLNLIRALEINPDDFAAAQAMGRIQNLFANQDK